MGLYRKSYLFIKGLMYDSKSGYANAAKLFTDDDLDVDVNGVVFLITGSNSGVGYETAKAVAERGGIVHLVCRNEEKATKAKAEIEAETKSKEIYIHILDMTRIKDVQGFVKKFVEDHGKLDVLINNAGEMCPVYEKTKTENLEVNFATNVVGPFALTVGLIPLLKKSKSNPRVNKTKMRHVHQLYSLRKTPAFANLLHQVNIGSAGMMLQRLDVNYCEKHQQKFDGIMAYAQCKRQLAVLTEIWAKAHPEIHFSCMHPGWVDTPAARRGLGEFYEKMKEKFRAPEEGADTIVWLAISKESLSVNSGSFFQDRRPVNKHAPMARTKESATARSEMYKLLTAITESL